MIDEQYINGTYFKRYSNLTNKHLVFLLTGQSMTPRAFWDFKLPEGKTHSEYFNEAGIDVILFDPVGYGKATDFYNYDRIGYAEQIKKVTDTLTKDYQSKTILGFSTSTVPAVIASTNGYFDKLAFHSPCIKYSTNIIPQEDVFKTSIYNLKNTRLKQFGDRIIPNPNRVDNWEESITEVLETTRNYNDGWWEVPGQIVRDISNYYAITGSFGFDPDKVPQKVFSIHGQYDFEMMKFGCEVLLNIRPDLEIVVVPNSTHFSMWENENKIPRDAIIAFCKE